MAEKKMETEEYPTLGDIRQALAEVDKKREEKSLSDEEREILELSAVALRHSERLLVARTQKEVIKDMETSTSSINALAKEIRSKVTEMNRVPKAIDRIESVIKVVVSIINAVAKWSI
jgi:hypothetical protein